MKRKYQKSTGKLTRSVFKVMAVLLIAFAIYGGITAFGAYQNTIKRNYENIDYLVDNAIDNISQSLAMIEGTMISLSGSDAIVNWRNNNSYFNSGDKDEYLHIKDLTTQIQHVLIYNNGWNLDLFDYVSVYEDDKLLAYTYTKPYSVQAIINKSSLAYEKVKNQSDYSQTLVPTNDDSTIYTTLRIQSDFSGENSIYIIGATPTSCFEDSIKKYVGYENSKAYLVGNDGTIYAANVNGMLGDKLPENILYLSNGSMHKDYTVDGVKYVIAKKNVNNQFSFIFMLPKSVIIRETLESLESLLVLSIITMVIMVVLVTMVETQYRTRLLEEETELKFLQQQMNPHFLFNILLTIQIKAKMSGDETVSKMITSLSNLLRAGIYKDSRSVVSIKEELKYVEYYLSLQKERYDDRLNYEISVENDSLLSCEVPRLSIEPLVENAIVHGVESSSEEGNVLVRVYEESGELLVSVKDNGVGFDINDLQKKRINEEGVPERDKVGLFNTDNRIKLMYGNKYGLNIDSRINEGTEVTVKLPKKKWVIVND